jgi:hypothetical protein
MTSHKTRPFGVSGTGVAISFAYDIEKPHRLLYRANSGRRSTLTPVN